MQSSCRGSHDEGGTFCAMQKYLESKSFYQLFMENIVRLHGGPKLAVSDMGSIFASHFTVAMVEMHEWFR
jgi:hypothetical protein